MFVLVYAPHGIVGEDGSKVVVTDTLGGAHYEMYRQVCEHIDGTGHEVDDYSMDERHATAGLYGPDAPEWHIYEA